MNNAPTLAFAMLHFLTTIPLATLLFCVLACLLLLNACIWYANSDVLRAIHETPAAFSLKEERRHPKGS